MLHDELEGATTCYAAACALLRSWRGRPADVDVPTGRVDDSYVNWGRLVNRVEHWFRSGRRDGHLSAADKRKIRQWIGTTPDLDAVHAVAWGIDVATWVTFPDAWRDEVFPSSGDRWTPRPGDLYPVGDFDAELLPPGTKLSTRPSAKFVDPDELPHVRAYQPTFGRGEPVAIEFDFGSVVPLTAVLSGTRTVATVHPNIAIEEFDIPEGPLAYPVVAVRPDQADVVRSGCAHAIAGGATLVVVPELATTPDIVQRLQEWLDDQPEEACVVAGSVHVEEDGEPANVAHALLPDAVPLKHRKITPCTDHVSERAPNKEGIKAGRRVVTVHVAGRFRFACVICKDALDPGVQDALARAGVNFLAVPAMSDTVDDFPSVIGEFVGQTQGVAVVANNPTRRNGAEVRPAGLFGQPVADRRIATAPGDADPCGRGVGLHALGGETTWAPLEDR